MSNPHPRKWSARDLDVIKRMFLSDGATYLQIAETMGSTRSAIAGLCGRRLWHRARKAAPPPPPAPKKRKGSNIRASVKGSVVVRVKPRPVNLNTGYGCQWIEDDPSGRQFCGQPGYPWCADHHKACYIPARVRVR